MKIQASSRIPAVLLPTIRKLANVELDSDLAAVYRMRLYRGVIPATCSDDGENDIVASYPLDERWLAWLVKGGVVELSTRSATCPRLYYRVVRTANGEVMFQDVANIVEWPASRLVGTRDDEMNALMSRIDALAKSDDGVLAWCDDVAQLSTDATEGPWRAEDLHGLGDVSTCVVGKSHTANGRRTIPVVADMVAPADAAYIAKLDPERVRKAADEIHRLNMSIGALKTAVARALRARPNDPVEDVGDELERVGAAVSEFFLEARVVASKMERYALFAALNDVIGTAHDEASRIVAAVKVVCTTRELVLAQRDEALNRNAELAHELDVLRASMIHRLGKAVRAWSPTLWELPVDEMLATLRRLSSRLEDDDAYRMAELVRAIADVVEGKDAHG